MLRKSGFAETVILSEGSAQIRVILRFAQDDIAYTHRKKGIKMKKRIFLACLLMIFLPIVSLATIRPVVTVSSGIARANVYSSKVIAFAPFQNTYIGSNHYDTASDTGLFIGGEAVFQPNWAWQLGLSYFQNSSFIESGNVYFFSDPAFNNLTYQYQIQSRRISIDTKISHAFEKIWHPYLSASIGSAFNKAYQYTEYPVTTADLPMTQPFANHSNTSLTYSAGLGFDVDITEHWRLGAGYRFVNLGNVNLGTTPLQSSTGTISNSHIYTNELLAQISYLG